MQNQLDNKTIFRHRFHHNILLILYICIFFLAKLKFFMLIILLKCSQFLAVHITLG